jgi:hypothetical protein
MGSHEQISLSLLDLMKNDDSGRLLHQRWKSLLFLRLLPAVGFKVHHEPFLTNI